MAQGKHDAFAGWQTPCKAPRSDVCDNSQHCLCDTLCMHNVQSVTPTYARQRILAQAMEPVARLHPRTRNNGNAAPAKQEPDMTQEEIDTDMWLTNWIKTRNKCTQALEGNNYLNLAAVMAVLCESCSIRKTIVDTSRFVPPTNGGRDHNGLFVKGNYVVQPGDICTVMCSSEERFDNQPIDRQSYHIHGQNNQPGYYVVFSINPQAMLIGAAANGHFRENDPPSNAVYKQINVVINKIPQALTVLVATARIPGKTEVIMDYGSSFDGDTREPMPILAPLPP